MTSFEQLKMHSPNLVNANIDKIASLFPNCITEAQDEHGNLKKAIDFDLLRQELSYVLVEGDQERYRLDWPGKKEAILTANAPIAKTLRPCSEESVNFDTTQNLFIEGDNLDALKLLQENYLGKVKMIYIDPPYNTGNDFVYSDDFAESTEEFFEKSQQFDADGNRLVANTESNGRFHSDWLSMMFSRIKLARNLLTEDDFIFISIDENEIQNLKMICLEVFGASNFQATIMWKRKKEISNDSKNISVQGEYILVIAKSNDSFLKSEPLSKEYIEKSYKEPTLDFPESKWRPVPITVSKGLSGGGYSYEIIAPNGTKHNKLWAYPEKSFERLVKDKRVYWGSDGNSIPQKVMYLHESKGQPTTNYWDNVSSNKEGKKIILDLFEKNIFETIKPVALIKKMISLTCDKDDLILDFFAGSSTTAHAVIDLNVEDGGKRKFVMVQLPDSTDERSEAFKTGYKAIAEISKERIRRAGQKILADNAGKKGIENLDIGFRVLKVDSSNMKDVYYTPDSLKKANLDFFESNIKEDRTDEDLMFQVMLDWGLELSLPIEPKQILDKTVYFVAGNSLVACFQPLSMELIDQIAQQKPLRFVSAEKSIVNDHDKTNIRERFKQLSPETDVKFL